jgi:hypothetical protein
MAKHKKAELSAKFLESHRQRLDAIGPWTIEADSDNLDINWAAPSALANDWVKLGLRFHTDSGSSSFDPDERMFELWEMFRSRQAEFIDQIRQLTEEMISEVGEVESAVVVVYREGHEEEDYYTLSVWFEFEDDPEHLYQVDYNEDKDAFTSISA